MSVLDIADAILSYFSVCSQLYWLKLKAHFKALILRPNTHFQRILFHKHILFNYHKCQICILSTCIKLVYYIWLCFDLNPRERSMSALSTAFLVSIQTIYERGRGTEGSSCLFEQVYMDFFVGQLFAYHVKMYMYLDMK